MNRLGLDYLTLAGAAPDAFVRLAAEAGCGHVALPPALSDIPGARGPSWSLIADAHLRSATREALADTGISLALIDGYVLYPDSTADDHRRVLDLAADLGTRRVNTVSFVDWPRTLDETAWMVALAAEYGMTVVVEPCAMLTAASLAQALDLIAHVGLPNFKLLIDTMHVARTGEAGDLGALDPGMIDYVQISDAPLAMPSLEAYMEEALHERMIPGTGELPLVEMLRAVPETVVISAEVPLRSLRDAGVSDLERARRVVAGVNRILAAAGG